MRPEMYGGPRGPLRMLVLRVVLKIIAELLLLASCSSAEPTATPTARPAWPPATGQPQAQATRSAPLAAPTRVRMTPPPAAWALRAGLATPEAPVLDPVGSYLTNLRCYGDCVEAGNSSLLMTDFVPYWSHADPVGVDYYEVWQGRGECYFDPETCVGCALVGVTTAMTATITDSPPAFNPVAGTSGAELGSGPDCYVVRAVNGGGAGDASNAIGVMTFSLMQGGTDLFTWPPPTPTLVP